MLPRVEGRCAVALCVTGKNGVWEVGWRQTAAAHPAAEADARKLAGALVSLAEQAGLSVPLPPSLVLGGTVMDGGEVARVPVSDGVELTLRGHAVERGIDAVQALDAAREVSEEAVLELHRGLDEVFKLSVAQCDEVKRIATSFDSASSLGAALTAAEGEIEEVGRRLHGVLTGHLDEVGGAAASAHDIIKLADAVAHIAQSARMLTFNAKVESARLGAQGKGFVVIAGAISELANNVSRSNDMVTALAEELAQKLPALRTATQELASATEAQLSGLKGRLVSLRETFQAARERAQAELAEAEGAADAVKSRSHDVVRHLQFQDRACQLIQRAQAHVRQLEATLGVEETPGEDLIGRVGALGRKLKDQTAGLASGEAVLF